MNELTDVVVDGAVSWGFDSLHNAVLFVLVPVLMALRAGAAKRNAEALERFRPRAAARELRAGKRIQPWLLSLGLTLLIVAAMQPRWGFESEEVPNRGRDIVVLLDVSQSMLAQEGGRTRLDRARAAVAKLVDTVAESGGHRLALIAFAGRASLLCPLTSDYELFRERLAQASPDKAPRPGSHIGYGIRQALHGFGGLTRDYSDIVLISDGEDHGSAPATAARNAAGLGVSIYAVGIGDTESGAPVPAPWSSNAEQDLAAGSAVNAGGERIMAYGGAPVLSRMNAELLSKLARTTNGAYLGVSEGTPRMGEFYERYIASKPRRELQTVSNQTRVHRYQWFAAAGLVLLILEMLWRQRRRGGPHGRTAAKSRRTVRAVPLGAATAAIALAALGLVGFKLWESAASLNEEANVLFHSADYAGAVGKYEQALQRLQEGQGDRLANEAIVHFNQAGAEFKQYRFRDSFDSYTRAADDPDVTLASRARYNIANVKYQQALNAMQTFQDAVTPTREAITWLRSSLELAPDQPDALFNLELALEMLRQLDRQKAIVEQSPQPSGESSTSALSIEGDSSSPPGGDKDEEASENPTEDDDEKSEGAALKAPSERDDEPPPGGASKDAATQRELSAEQAEQMIEIARDRHEAAQAQRQQWRRARMNDGQIAKAW